jgi:hypothetical protein
MNTNYYYNNNRLDLEEKIENLLGIDFYCIVSISVYNYVVSIGRFSESQVKFCRCYPLETELETLVEQIHLDWLFS